MSNMRFARHKFLRLFTPLCLLFYLLMVWLTPIASTERNSEIFPFFSWRLFDEIPERFKYTDAVIVHSIYGAPVDGARYIIPSHIIDHTKSLRRAMNVCRESPRLQCDAAVRRFVAPAVNEIVQGDAKFSIVRASVDLRDLQAGIGAMESGDADLFAFYRLHRVMGRWSSAGDTANLYLADYEAVYERIIAGDYGEPAAHEPFRIYRGADRLTYFKADCAAEDTRRRFFLHLTPARVQDIPGYRQQYGFDNLDFDFQQFGERFGGNCLAVVPLPGYPIERIKTGQYIRGEGQVWDVEFAGDAGAEPAARRDSDASDATPAPSARKPSAA